MAGMQVLSATLPISNSLPSSDIFSTFNVPSSEAVGGGGNAITLPTSQSHDTLEATVTGFSTSTTGSSFVPPPIAFPTFSNPSPTAFSVPPATRSSEFATLIPTSNNLEPTLPHAPIPPTLGSLTLPDFSPSELPGSQSTTLPEFSPFGLPSLQPTGVLMAYDPVSTVTFSRLQTSFSAIGVGSNILAVRAYFVMFGFYLKVLRMHGAARNRSLTAATILLFIFCTAHCALQISTTTLYNQSVSTSLGDSEHVFDRTFKDYSALAVATNAVYVTSNVIADSIFVSFSKYCAATPIWNFQLKIIIFPTLLTLAVAGVGYTNAFWHLHTPNALRFPTLVVAEFSFELLKISILLSIFTTVILMILTAGRIWWIARSARTLLGQTVTGRYYTACAMILESGAITCASAIVFAAIGFTLDPIYGIAPTIIAVRVGLGRSVDNIESFVAAQKWGL
ncbi:hypothetical protein B0H12DRAFT_1108890 [Mycena haematopus]|nr:hypothetical protein B0H12DRAFT_1108890 [Mycena haematopus]